MNRIEAMVLSVLQRPAMYTVKGSYAEVVSFLSGYYSGVALGHPHEPSVGIWREFSGFIGASLKVPTSQVFEAFQDRHGAASLEALKSMYAKFEKLKETGLGSESQ